MLCVIGSGLGLLSQPASWRAGTARSYTPRACIRVEKPPPSGLCESARTATAPEQARSGRLASGQRPAGCPSGWPGAAAAGASCARRREWQDGGATLRPVELLPGHAAALMESRRMAKRAHALSERLEAALPSERALALGRASAWARASACGRA